MQVLVTFRHIEATDALRHYAEGKVARIRKFMHRPIEAHVVLSVVKHRHIAEVTLSADHLKLNATEETGDLYSAIDLALGKIERQIKKRLTKRQSRKHVANAERTEETPPRTTRPRIKTERVPAEPMTVREAVRRADREGTDYLFFYNVTSETLSLLLRRRDGSYGLIEPETVES
jgi:putative sigma-54 modulation protein